MGPISSALRLHCWIRGSVDSVVIHNAGFASKVGLLLRQASLPLPLGRRTFGRIPREPKLDWVCALKLDMPAKSCSL